MAPILGIDTSTLVGSVAVLDGERLLGETTLRVRATHGESLLPVVERVLADAGVAPRDIGLLAYARGPGSFTGIRIGMATVKGIALALGTPTLGVSSLRALAMHCVGASGLVCPITDARKHEVYMAAYRMTGRGPEEVLPERVLAPERVGEVLAARGEAPIHLLGDGLDVHADPILAALGPRAWLHPSGLVPPRGAFVALLAARAFAAGEREDLGTAAPTYLRPPEAEYRVPKLLR